MRDKRIHLVALAEWDCPGSHYLHTKKFLSSFETHGYTYSEVRKFTDIRDISPDDIVYLSNHGFFEKQISFEVLEAISKKGAKQILWFWHDHLDLAKRLFANRFVLSGEHFYKKPFLDEHIKLWEIQKTTPEYVPLTFASDLMPSSIATLPRSEMYLAHFVGFGYQADINKRLRIRFRGIKILNTPPFISEKQRTDIFLSSKVALGWHSDANIKNNVVVERVFEGLAYGNAVISDTPIAREITDGIVEFADTYDETRDFLLRIKKDDEFRKKKVEQGFAWAKAYGTYWHVAKRFIDHFAS